MTSLMDYFHDIFDGLCISDWQHVNITENALSYPIIFILNILSDIEGKQGDVELTRKTKTCKKDMVSIITADGRKSNHQTLTSH